MERDGNLNHLGVLKLGDQHLQTDLISGYIVLDGQQSFFFDTKKTGKGIIDTG